MREIGALVRFDADTGKRLVDLLVQRLQPLVRRDAGPHGLGQSATVEQSDTAEGDFETRVVDRTQSRVDVAGAVSVDFADEAQGQMELLVTLPACTADPTHGRQKQGADPLGRSYGDEQPVHALLIAKPASGIMVSGSGPMSGFA